MPMISCSQNPFCSSLPDSVRKKLCTGCRQRLSRAGSTQLYDDFSKEVTLILDGAIYGASPVSEADIGETEFLPLFVLCLPGRPLSLDATFRDECGFADIPHGFNEVLCLTDCRIASFSHELFRSLFESDSAFASALMRAATGLMMDISQISAITRASSTYVATCLLMQKLMEFELYLSRVDIALVLGCNRSSVNRAVMRIQREQPALYEGYCANKGRHITLYGK